MPKNSVNIFLIEPIEKSKYKSMLVFADNAQTARIAANLELNPVRIKIPKQKSPESNHVYSSEQFSTCQKITVEIIFSGKDYVHIKYLGKEYHLTKDFAETLA